MGRGIVMEENNWISVEERLPEDTESHIITCNREVCRSTGIYNNSKWFVVNYDIGGFTEITNVTHWQPLPPPPDIK